MDCHLPGQGRLIWDLSWGKPNIIKTTTWNIGGGKKKGYQTQLIITLRRTCVKRQMSSIWQCRHLVLKKRWKKASFNENSLWRTQPWITAREEQMPHLSESLTSLPGFPSAFITPQQKKMWMGKNGIHLCQVLFFFPSHLLQVLAMKRQSPGRSVMIQKWVETPQGRISYIALNQIQYVVSFPPTAGKLAPSTPTSFSLAYSH